MIVEPAGNVVPPDFIASGHLPAGYTSAVIGFVVPAGSGGPPFPGKTIPPLPGFDWSVEFVNVPVGPGQTLTVETVTPPIVSDSKLIDVVP